MKSLKFTNSEAFSEGKQIQRHENLYKGANTKIPKLPNFK